MRWLISKYANFDYSTCSKRGILKDKFVKLLSHKAQTTLASFSLQRPLCITVLRLTYYTDTAYYLRKWGSRKMIYENLSRRLVISI